MVKRINEHNRLIHEFEGIREWHDRKAWGNLANDEILNSFVEFIHSSSDENAELISKDKYQKNICVFEEKKKRYLVVDRLVEKVDIADFKYIDWYIVSHFPSLVRVDDIEWLISKALNSSEEENDLQMVKNYTLCTMLL